MHTCLLVGAFNPFTFKVIIHIYDPITIFLIILVLFSIGLYLLLFSACHTAVTEYFQKPALCWGLEIFLVKDVPRIAPGTVLRLIFMFAESPLLFATQCLPASL